MPVQMHRQVLGERFKEGHRLMWMELQRRKLTVAGLAKLLGYSSATVVRWLYGDRTPDRAASGVIHAKLGIEPGKFDEKIVRPFVPPAAKAA